MKQMLIQDQHCFIIFLQQQSTYATIFTTPSATHSVLMHSEKQRNSKRKPVTVTVKLYCVLGLANE
jgi:hypothetical protein